MTPSLPSLSTRGRIDRLRAEIVEAGCDALVVSNRTDIRWCTGFTGSWGALIVTPERAVVLTDSRYAEQAPAELDAADSDAAVEIVTDPVAAGIGHLGGARRVGLQAGAVTWAEQRRWADTVDDDIELIPTADLVAGIRARKDDAELARITAAAAIADAALTQCRPLLVPGSRERAVAAALDDAMRAAGATGPAYATIVAGGPNSARPHATPTDREFRRGELVVIDVGAEVDGYRSDMTRTFVLGEPDARTAALLALVETAQRTGVAAVGPGVTAGSVDEAARGVIDDAGHGEAFGHGTGHGVGLDIHELPAVRRDNTAILQPGHVLTVEPGVYLPGFGGVRVEDTVVVTAEGCEPVTRTPKDPVVR